MAGAEHRATRIRVQQALAILAAGGGWEEGSRIMGLKRSATEKYLAMARQITGEGYELDEDDETPREARARVADDLAAGRRCPRCHLLLPHDDCLGVQS